MGEGPSTSDDRARVVEAVELATANVGDGGGPFGAVVVLRDGRCVTGVNRVTVTPDPTAHAEVEAIRAAAALCGDEDLSGSALYASCEPCPMCLAASMWARIDRVVHAATAEDAAAAGFDDTEFRRQLGLRRPQRPAIEHLPVPGQDAPFEAWAAVPDREDY